MAFLVKYLFYDNPDHDNDGDQNYSNDDKFHELCFHVKLGPSANSFFLFENFPEIGPLISKFACFSNLYHP
ncbi:hypothetical protein D0X99_17625 [Algoriphagus lacus]|uniref:Uncharacterized protein n=1 Tax=Algoriphagus lacus TaxID=2056311 RepID=A0A418PMW8_9BACT|nr:hypothetical protein D0X99_17625 [Algoriphagus lacus]